MGNIRIQNEKELLKKLFNREQEMSDSLTPQIAPVIPTTPVAVVPAPDCNSSSTPTGRKRYAQSTFLCRYGN